MDKKSPFVLLIEDDLEIRETLHMMLNEEGYEVASAASLAEGLDLVRTHAFHFILSDTFRHPGESPFTSLEELRRLAYPTPVGVMTAWNVSPDEAHQQEFACLIKKPFDIEHLLTEIAACLDEGFTPEQERQAEVVREYLAALNQADIDKVLRLCTEEMVYQPPPPASGQPHTRLVRGKADYGAYLRGAYQTLRDFQIEQATIYPHPTGLALRYSTRWTAHDGSTQRLAASLILRFQGQYISQFGVEVSNPSAWQQLLQGRQDQSPSSGS